jgi:putative tryptophan/tyrosine transport system substrate-binding protein
VRRRDFIRAVAGSVVAWPLGARAQQPERIRRIGVLMNFAENDPAAQARLTAFLQALQQLGWTNGRNVRMDIRWSAGDPERNRRYAAELVALTPDAILASTNVSVAALLQATPCPSFSCRSLIQLELGSLRVWRSRAATPPDLPFTSTAWVRNG